MIFRSVEMIVPLIPPRPQADSSRSMQTKILFLAIAVTIANASFAQTPPMTAVPIKPAATTAALPASAANANAITALCKDGTSYTGDTKKGACSGHKGVKTWTSDATLKSAPKADAAKNSTSMANAAPGGGAGKVWLNTRSHVYHCPADK